MSTYSFRYKIILILILLVLSACDIQGNSLQTQETESAVDETATESMLAATPIVQTEQTLTICMAGEPRSLFLYGDNSLAARNIHQAIYDGPVEYHGYDAEAPILEKVPDLQNGAVSFAPAAADANALIADIDRCDAEPGRRRLLFPGWLPGRILRTGLLGNRGSQPGPDGGTVHLKRWADLVGWHGADCR